MTLMPPTRSKSLTTQYLQSSSLEEKLTWMADHWHTQFFTRGKRNRSCEEEDFLPLSKKINNLHINNWGNSHQEQSAKWNNSPEQFLNHYSQDLPPDGRQDSESRNSSPYKNAQDQNGFSETDLNEHYKHLNEDSYKNRNYLEGKYINGEGSSHESRVQNNWSTVYNPDLGIDENPYYYESNKLLFGLYVERLQRGGY